MLRYSAFNNDKKLWNSKNWKRVGAKYNPFFQMKWLIMKMNTFLIPNNNIFAKLCKFAFIASTAKNN